MRWKPPRSHKDPEQLLSDLQTPCGSLRVADTLTHWHTLAIQTPLHKDLVCLKQSPQQRVSFLFQAFGDLLSYEIVWFPILSHYCHDILHQFLIPTWTVVHRRCQNNFLPCICQIIIALSIHEPYVFFSFQLFLVKPLPICLMLLDLIPLINSILLCLKSVSMCQCVSLPQRPIGSVQVRQELFWVATCRLSSLWSFFF